MRMREPENKDAIVQSFAVQASAFGDGRLTLARQEYLNWMTTFIAPAAADAILDVASGTGHLALALAEVAGQVHSLDLTEAMQAEAVRECGKRGLKNMTFKIGNAEDLPYADGTFDKVTSRFAFHHFLHPEKALAEMLRVLKPDGSAFVIDMIVPEGDAGVGANDYERLRDPSHTHSLTHRRFIELIAALGLRLDAWEGRRIEVETERWLELTKTPVDTRARIMGDFESEMAGGKPTGMKPFRKGGIPHFEQNWNMYRICKGK
jgi:ubiquinone/menaquinone biosynthesis C-methylase UbiE